MPDSAMIELDALRQKCAALRAQVAELEEQNRKAQACIVGLRHTIQTCQDAIVSQAVAMSLLTESGMEIEGRRA